MPTFVAPKGSTADYKVMPPGMYIARCIHLIQLGTHQEEFEGKKKTLNKLWIGFEFPTELEVFKEGGRPEPYTVGREFTFSMFDTSALRKALDSWKGKAFTQEEADAYDIGRLLGKAASVNVLAHTSKSGKESAKIGTISPVMKGQECPPQVNPTLAFSLTPAEYDQVTFDQLPKFLQDKIRLSPEYKALVGDTQPGYQGPPAITDAVPTNMHDDFNQDSGDVSELPF